MFSLRFNDKNKQINEESKKEESKKGESEEEE